MAHTGRVSLCLVDALVCGALVQTVSMRNSAVFQVAANGGNENCRRYAYAVWPQTIS